MIILIKFIHFICFSVAIGGGVANMVVGKRAATMDPPTAMPLRLTQATLGKISTGALALLWVSGIWLWLDVHEGSFDMATAFQIKIAAVIVLTLINIYLNLKVIAAKKASTPPDAELAKKAGMGMSAMALLAVLTAIIAFSAL